MPVIYWVITGEVATVADFLSNKAKGRRLHNPTPERRRLWAGISVNDAIDDARTTAQKWPRMGRYIATLEITDVTPIQWERTTDTPGHYTLWGDPIEMVNAVSTVVPV